MVKTLTAEAESEILATLQKVLQHPYGEWVWTDAKYNKRFKKGDGDTFEWTLRVCRERPSRELMLAVELFKWEAPGEKVGGGSMYFPDGLTVQDYVSRIHAAIWFITGAFP